MRLQEPQVLVQDAGGLVEQVRRDLVPGAGTLLDGDACLLGRRGEAVRQRSDVVETGEDICRIGFQGGCFRYDLRTAQRHSAKRSDAFGQAVGQILHATRQFIEELVRLHEIRALHVPVCLLDRKLEVEQVDQARLQQRNNLLPHLGGQVDTRGVHGALPVSYVEAMMRRHRMMGNSILSSLSIEYIYHRSADPPQRSGSRSEFDRRWQPATGFVTEGPPGLPTRAPPTSEIQLHPPWRADCSASGRTSAAVNACFTSSSQRSNSKP